MSESNGRAGDGRFTIGNPGGPGRPRREMELQYLDATIAAIPIERWTKVVAKALDDAEAGDAKAREWLGKVLGIEAAQRIDNHHSGEFLSRDELDARLERRLSEMTQGNGDDALTSK